MYQIYSRPKETLSLDLLKKGDEDQWDILISFYRWRLIAFTPVPEGQERFKEDIVANVIADIYVARSTFDSVEHMVNHMFAAVRYESKNMMTKREGRYLFDDDVLARMSDYLPSEVESLDDRRKYESWKDEAISRLTSSACRLPTKWKNFILVHLKYGREEIPAHRRALGFANIPQRERVFAHIKELMAAPQPGSIYELHEHEMRIALRKLSKREKSVLVKTVAGMQLPEIAAELKMGTDAVRVIASRLTRKLSGVVKVPDVFGTSLDFIKYIADGKFKELVKSEFEGRMDKTAAWKLNSEQIREIILMRDEQMLTWVTIAARIGCSQETAKNAYKDSGRKPIRVRGLRLTIDQVIEMRRIYKEEIKNISAIARLFKIDFKTAWGILKGDGWKEALYNTPDPAAPKHT